MRMRLLGVLFTLGLSSISIGQAVPAKGSDAALHPTKSPAYRKIATLKRRPALPVLIRDTLYYTEFQGNGDLVGCVGKDIHAYSISKKRDEQVLTVPCVKRLFSDGTTLFIYGQETPKGDAFSPRDTRDQDRLWELFVEGGAADSLATAFPSILGLLNPRGTHRSRVDALFDSQRIPRESVHERWFQVAGPSLAILTRAGQTDKKALAVDLFLTKESTAQWNRPAILTHTHDGKEAALPDQTITDFVFDGQRGYLFFDGSAKELGKVASFDVGMAALGKVTFTIGGAAKAPATRNLKPAPAKESIFRALRFAQNIPDFGWVALELGGQVIWDRQQFLTFYSRREDKVYPVILPPRILEGIAGLHWVTKENGLIIADSRDRSLYFLRFNGNTQDPFGENEILKPFSND